MIMVLKDAYLSPGLGQPDRPTAGDRSPPYAGVSNLWPRVAMNAAQHKIVNLLKTL